MFYKKGVLRNFAKFTGKHLSQSLFFNKDAGLQPETLLKRDSGTEVFLSILQNFLEHLFYYHLQAGLDKTQYRFLVTSACLLSRKI